MDVIEALQHTWFATLLDWRNPGPAENDGVSKRPRISYLVYFGRLCRKGRTDPRQTWNLARRSRTAAGPQGKLRKKEETFYLVTASCILECSCSANVRETEKKLLQKAEQRNEAYLAQGWE